MESDRFDDVGYRIIEEPEPPRAQARRRGRRRAAVASALLVAGAIATSATALATTDDGAAPPAKGTPSYDAGSQFRHHGHHGCRHGDRSGGGADQGTSLRY